MRPMLWGPHDGVFPLSKPGVQGTGPSLSRPSRASPQEWLSLLLPRVTLDEGPNSLLEPKVQAQPCGFLAAMLPPEPQPSCPCPLARLPARPSSLSLRQSQAVSGGWEPPSTYVPWTGSCFLDCMTLKMLVPRGLTQAQRCAWRQGQTFLSFIFNK